MLRKTKSRAAAGVGLERGCKSPWQLPRDPGWEKSLLQVISRRLLYGFPGKSRLWLRKSKPPGAAAAGRGRAKRGLQGASPGRKPSSGKRLGGLAKAQQGPEQEKV